MSENNDSADLTRLPKKRSWRLWIAVALLLVGISTGLIVARQTQGPRTGFRADLSEKFDDLVGALKDLRPGNTEREEDVTATHVGKDGVPIVRKTKWEAPLAMTICGNATTIASHFEKVPLSLLGDAQRDVAWGDALKADYSKRLKEVSTELARIKEQYMKDPNAFGTKYFSPSVGLSEKGELYFVCGEQERQFIERRLNFDLAAWIAEINKKALQLPRNTK